MFLKEANIFDFEDKNLSRMDFRSNRCFIILDVTNLTDFILAYLANLEGFEMELVSLPNLDQVKAISY